MNKIPASNQSWKRKKHEKFSWIYIHAKDIIGFSADLNWLEDQIWTANLLEVSGLKKLPKSARKSFGQSFATTEGWSRSICCHNNAHSKRKKFNIMFMKVNIEY